MDNLKTQWFWIYSQVLAKSGPDFNNNIVSQFPNLSRVAWLSSIE